jgi:uncharacterized membrane protein YoaK (UPF0700 family)
MSEVLVLRRPRPPAIVPPLLSFTAGFIDSFTFLALFGLFVAQVTGSFVLAAAAIATNEQGALTQLLAIPVFLLAGVTTTALAVMLERRGRAALAWLLGLECAVLTGLLLTALIGAPHVASTNVMTTNTTQIAIDATELVLVWQARRRAPADAAAAAAYAAARARFGALFAIMLGFLVGTAVGTLAYVATGAWGLLLPLAIMYAIFAWASARPLAQD